MFASEIMAGAQATGDTVPPQQAQGTQGTQGTPKSTAPTATAKGQSFAVGVVWFSFALLALLIGRASSE